MRIEPTIDEIATVERVLRIATERRIHTEGELRRHRFQEAKAIADAALVKNEIDCARYDALIADAIQAAQ